ncbi:putative urate catabolism protein (plasmid) [Aminobacter sp. MSH1]|uniref:polysaccharide deacetylase family protein n=1 Tax=Aminobacter sp. MSH1 TaxID=374606 RepID=UPI000D397E76|nr:polysaccharide deacetylase family protein [Aminobacter sp. MSH1]AWC26024.1 putative urate catabolism protein [Aminobacter sp. MSH1]
MSEQDSQGPARDFIGYGAIPPNPKWPGSARLAVNIALNIEEGSEYSPLDGDARTDTALTEGEGMDTGIAGRDLAAESMYEYGSRVGVWRLLRMLADRNVPYTAFACALALERHRELAERIAADGADICCHGWRWEKPWLLTREQEREHIQRAIDSLQATVGRKPEGWCCRYGPSTNTRELLVEAQIGYDSDAYNDEVPYWVEVKGVQQLIVPYSLVTNDCKLVPRGLQTADEFHALLRDAFDQLYEEGAEAPRMLNIGLHPRMAGHPGRARGLARFLDHIVGHKDVWICRRADIASHWKTHFPAPATGAEA